MDATSFLAVHADPAIGLLVTLAARTMRIASSGSFSRGGLMGEHPR